LSGTSNRHRFLLGLEILAFCAFLWRRLILDAWLEKGRPLCSTWVIWAGIALAAAAFGLSGVKLYARFLASKTAARETELRKSIALSFTPLLFLFLTFLQFFVALRNIDRYLILLSAAGFLILQAVFLARLEWLPSRQTWIHRFSKSLDGGRTRNPRLSLAVLLVTLSVYIVYLSGLVFPSHPLTGDEPHYALIARSLLTDGDVNLHNDYHDRNYEPFYAGLLDPHAVSGKKGEASLYSRHFPALPVLLAPFYAAGEKAAGIFSRLADPPFERRNVLVFFLRLPVCLLASLLGLVFFLCARELTGRASIAIAVWLVFSFSAPMIFYSHLIYPEIPAALILAWMTLELILKRRRSERSLFFAGLGIGLLPWFALKYLVLSLVAFLVVLSLVLQDRRRKFRLTPALLGPILISAGFYVHFLLSSFGSLSPAKIYLGLEATQGFSFFRILAVNSVDFGRRFFGLLFDQRAGFMVLAPVYALSLAGFLALRKKRPKESAVLLAFPVVFWLFSSLTPYWGGYCPPGRPFLPVLWVLGLFLACALFLQPGRAARTIGAVLIGLTLVMTFLAVRTPRLLYHEGLSSLSLDIGGERSSKLLAGLSNILVDWTKLVPSLSSRATELRNWTPLVFWLIAVFGINLLWLRKRRSDGKGTPNGLNFFPEVALVLLIGGLISVHRIFDVRLAGGFELDQGKMTVFPQDQNSHGEEGGGFWIKGRSRSFLVLQTDEPVAEFQLTLSSPVEGETGIRIGTAKRRVERTVPAGRPTTLRISSPRGLRWHGHLLYALEIEEKGQFFPYKIDRNSKDRRPLGVFVRLSGRSAVPFLP